MNEVYHFINMLFERSRALNDINTKFLNEINLDEMTLNQRLELFQRNTKYHEVILDSIKQIVNDLDKTSVLLDEKDKILLDSFHKLNDTNVNKLIDIAKLLEKHCFVPKKLTTCPICGNILISERHHEGKCKKVPLYIGNNLLGYTIRCNNMPYSEEDTED